MPTTSYIYEGTTYEAEWDFVGDDNIVVYLPNGLRETCLGKLRPEDAAKNHLKIYVHAMHGKK